MFTLRSVRQRLDFAKSNLYTRVKKNNSCFVEGKTTQSVGSFPASAYFLLACGTRA